MPKKPDVKGEGEKKFMGVNYFKNSNDYRKL
jgi:hypothetical protein